MITVIIWLAIIGVVIYLAVKLIGSGVFLE
mgnify:CR=1 FL=1